MCIATVVEALGVFTQCMVSSNVVLCFHLALKELVFPPCLYKFNIRKINDGNMEKIEFDFTKDGPILVKKDGKIEFALCRCGHSAKKPFCNGAHVQAAFKADEHRLELK
jgi:CDGSH-type Zn-finger protein